MSQDESVVLNQDQETSTSGLPILPKSTIWRFANEPDFPNNWC